ncbi:hypothetical protein NEFER03_0113 [Nematocida sp. LUAm3]|nr:hypothetical protein NEFER03_0113 [Nematocida sp. LUAm3]KAI5173566.1 hypothetical protein NEFER02_0082 [Nematocida sp. LUAm2]KAI5176787.1 hypothetical protein NEFER01_0112 [Nematocida sp. LUAm1]
MEKSARGVKEVIEGEEENKKCVDCGSPRPQWASVTYGVFLCLNCAGVHRSFGVRTSVVKSVAMDLWSTLEVKRMEIGGNRLFLSYVKEKGLESLSKKALYYEKTIQRHRELLDREISKIFPELVKEEKTSQKPLNRSPHVNRASASTYSNTYSEKKEKYTADTLQSNITSALGRAAGYLYTGASALSGQISEKVITPASSIIKEKSQQLSEYMKKKETDSSPHKHITSEKAPLDKKKEAFDKWD